MGIETEELQAKRLLASFDRYRARHENTSMSVTEMAKKWFIEVFESTINRVPAQMRGRVERAQMFHEILENRWYLSEQKGSDVGLEFAADNYVKEILPNRRDSGVDLIDH
jgi:exopolyphosphatase/pppGpp-phosphohydrolase